MIFRRKREKLTGSCFVTEGGKGVFATQVQKNFFDGREQNGEAQRKAMKTFRTVAASLVSARGLTSL